MDSIFSQTEADWELIVGDSYSDDGTWEFFQQFKGDSRVRLYQIPRDGLYPGWNQCLARVRGRHCYIATSDDTMAPDFLEKMLALLEAAPSARIATCNFDFIDTEDQVIPPTQGIAGSFFEEWQSIPHLRSGLLDFLVHTELSISWTTMTSVLFERSLLEDVGCFRVDAAFSADRFWAMATALLSDTVHHPEYLATWRIHPGQVSSKPPQGWRKRNIELARETLLNQLPLIEAQIGKQPDLIEHLLFGVRRYYEESFCLDRLHIKTRPYQFALGVLRAALQEPEFLLRRLREAFRWETSVEDKTRELVAAWELPWPPQKLDMALQSKPSVGNSANELA